MAMHSAKTCLGNSEENSSQTGTSQTTSHIRFDFLTESILASCTHIDIIISSL